MKQFVARFVNLPARRFVSACALVLALPYTSHAAPTWSASPYSLYAQNESLTDVLRQFGSSFSLAVSLGPGVAGKVNGKFNANNPTEFLDRLGGVYGFNWFVYSGTLFVNSSSAMETRAISAKGSSISALREALGQLGVLDNRFGWGELPAQGIALVSGPRAYVDLVERTVAALPLGTGGQQVAVFRLKHASVNDRTVSYRSQNIVTPGLATTLRNLILGSGSGANNETLSAVAAPLRDNPPSFVGAASDVTGQPTGTSAGDPAVGGGTSPPPRGRAGADLRLREPTVQADARLNAIIVQDIPDRIPVYKALIDQLDLPSTLIEIEAVIVDVNSDYINELGVTWGARAGSTTFGYSDFGLATSGGLPLDSGASLAPGTIGLSVSSVLAARLRALQTRGVANVLSQPSILTADNLGALIDLSDTFFIQTVGERVASVTPITVGTSLRVTPRYIESDRNGRQVELAVDIEDGRIQDERSVGSLPTVRKSNISTLAIVGDGETLLVGGYNSSQDSQRTEKVPFLGDIPIIGALFSNKSQTTQRRERLFLLRPRVVSIQGERVRPPRLQARDTGPARNATWRGGDQPMSAGQYLDLVQNQQTRVRFENVEVTKTEGPIWAGPAYSNSVARDNVDIVPRSDTAVIGAPTVRVEVQPVTP